MRYKIMLTHKGDGTCDHSRESLSTISHDPNWKLSITTKGLEYKCSICGQKREHINITHTTKL